MKLAVLEAESEALRTARRDWPRAASSVISEVEVMRAVARADGDMGLAAEVLRSVDLVRVSDAIIASAARLRPVELRTVDAIHLATALAIGADLAAFVSYDARLVAAARDHGLSILAPS